MAVSSQVVTSQLPAAFETYYKTGDGASKGLIPQAFELYGQGTPQAFQQQYVDPLKAAGLYGTDRIAGLSPAQQQLGTQIGQLGNSCSVSNGHWCLGFRLRGYRWWHLKRVGSRSFTTIHVTLCSRRS
jgi:hypothetical protein